jgi:predicted RNA binding protein YcfA (HicA-like mRNA interferase family)
MSDTNVPFEDICHLLLSVGFESRIKGSHHIFNHDNLDEILNLQPKGNFAKPYQVKQVRNVILKYKLASDSHDSI